MEKYNGSNCATKEDKKDDDEATEHATTLEGGAAAAEACEEAEEGEHHQEDDDKGEVGGRGVVWRQGVLYVLANQSVFGVQKDVDGPSQTSSKDEKTQKVEKEKDEFDEIRTAATHCEAGIFPCHKLMITF